MHCGDQYVLALPKCFSKSFILNPIRRQVENIFRKVVHRVVTPFFTTFISFIGIIGETKVYVNFRKKLFSSIMSYL